MQSNKQECDVEYFLEDLSESVNINSCIKLKIKKSTQFAG